MCQENFTLGECRILDLQSYAIQLDQRSSTRNRKPITRKKKYWKYYLEYYLLLIISYFPIGKRDIMNYVSNIWRHSYKELLIRLLYDKGTRPPSVFSTFHYQVGGFLKMRISNFFNIRLIMRFQLRKHLLANELKKLSLKSLLTMNLYQEKIYLK